MPRLDSHFIISTQSYFKFSEKDPSLGLHTAWPSFGLEMMASQPTTMSLSPAVSSRWGTPLSECSSPHQILLAWVVPQNCSGPSAALCKLLPEDGLTAGRLTPLTTSLGWESGSEFYFPLKFVCGNPNSQGDSMRKQGLRDCKRIPQSVLPLPPCEDTVRSRCLLEGKGLSPELDHAGTLILDFRPLKL